MALNVYVRNISPTAVDYQNISAAAGFISLVNPSLSGATGNAGDYLTTLTVIPATVTCGGVTIKDGNGGNIVVHTGSQTLVDIKPFTVPITAFSVSGPWQVSCGASVSVLASGRFS